MKTYKTYQAAKMANPESEIWVSKLARCGRDNVFGTKISLSEITNNYFKCNLADHCMTVEKFLADGHRFVEGDIITGGVSIKEITSNITHAMNKEASCDVANYILRAAALENQMNIDKVETQTEHQEEISAFKSNPVIQLSINELDKFDSEPDSAFASINDAVDSCEWNGEGLPPVGVECEYKDGDNWYEVRVNYLSEWVMVIEALKSQSKWIDIKGIELSFDCSRFDSLKFRKPETPQQREERERLEAIDAMCWSVHSLKVSQAAALYDAGYRKGIK